MATHVKVDCLIPILMYEDGAYFINPNYNVIADFRIMEELQRIFRQQKNLKIRHMILNHNHFPVHVRA